MDEKGKRLKKEKEKEKKRYTSEIWYASTCGVSLKIL